MIFLLGVALGFWLGIRYSKARHATRVHAIQLVVGGGLTTVYLVQIVSHAMGMTTAEPSLLLAGMVAIVIAFIFPRSVVKISKDGLQVGSNSASENNSSEHGSPSAPQE